jgi:IS5 family transposase
MMIFKIIVLKHLYNNIPDGIMDECLLCDLYFRVFLRLAISDPTTDEKTIWPFHDRLCQAGVSLNLFAAFDEQLHAYGMAAKEGRIVDTSIVSVPVQHISTIDRETLDRGEIPAEWEQNPAIAPRRDSDTA